MAANQPAEIRTALGCRDWDRGRKPRSSASMCRRIPTAVRLHSFTWHPQRAPQSRALGTYLRTEPLAYAGPDVSALNLKTAVEPTKHTKGAAGASKRAFTGCVNGWNLPTPCLFVWLVCFVGSNCGIQVETTPALGRATGPCGLTTSRQLHRRRSKHRSRWLFAPVPVRAPPWRLHGQSPGSH